MSQGEIFGSASPHFTDDLPQLASGPASTSCIHINVMREDEKDIRWIRYVHCKYRECSYQYTSAKRSYTTVSLYALRITLNVL